MKKLLIILMMGILVGKMFAQEGSKIEITPFKAGIGNVYWLQYGDKALLVDSGEWGKEAKLEKQLRKAGLDPSSLDLLVITHGHADHAGGAAYLAQKYGIPVAAGSPEKNLLAQGHNPPLQPTSNFAKLVDKHIVKQDSFPPFEVRYWVEEEWDLSSLGFPLELRVMPGHTSGSLVLIGEDFAVVGDLIRGGLVARKTPKTHFFHIDEKQAEGFLQTLLDLGVQTFYLGHFGPLKAKKVEKFLHKKYPR